MNEEPMYLQTVSLHLSRVLDEIGLNQVTVKRRRRTFLFMEHSRTAYFRLVNKPLSFYHFGSQTEGATTLGLDSDIDTLICNQQYNAIQDWAEWQPGKRNLLMLNEDTAPCYCRLQVLRLDIPVPMDKLMDGARDVFDSSDRVIMKNTYLNNNMGRVRNGPAESRVDEPELIDHDFVQAIKCESWPRQAEEFTRRRRRHNWPTPGLLQQAVEHGCFLVPVGHKFSPTEHLEWRISASLAERCLMFSLNLVHIKVYVLLKMLMKTFVEPQARKSISSYHCKTALLYCIENTETGVWVERNILQCVTRCLAMLLSWVTKAVCPHFIITDENLFAGKVTAQNRGTLKSILKDLIKSNGRVCLGILIDDIGIKLHAKLSIEPSVLPVLNSLNTVLLIGFFEKEKQFSTNDVVNTVRQNEKNKNPMYVIRFVYKKIDMLRMLRSSISQINKPKQHATEAIIECLYGWLGSLLASISLSYKLRVPRMAIQLLRIGTTSDVTAMLKHASVLYSNGDYRKVETMLQRVGDHFNSNPLISICRCYDNPMTLPQEFIHMMYVLRERKTRAKLFASCVVFSRQEIHCSPPELRNEFFRSERDDLQHRDEMNGWMDLAAVDCLPFLHYLQYMTYRKLGKHDLQKQSLLNLEQCIREDNAFRHLETAWSLLGQCMELENDTSAAMACYKRSIEIRPRNNAANCHIQHLCYMWVKNGCLCI